MFLDCFEKPIQKCFHVHRCVDVRGAVDRCANRQCAVFSYFFYIYHLLQIICRIDRYYRNKSQVFFQAN